MLSGESLRIPARLRHRPEVNHAWIEEATRVGLVKGSEDVPGRQELKRVLGKACANLAAGCNLEALQMVGLRAIRARANGETIPARASRHTDAIHIPREEAS